eukprot:scaffold38739_cov53-Phaeocystis_antarctica.AAC.1
MSRGGEVWQGCWGHRRWGWLAGNRLVDGGLPDLQGAPRAYNQNPCLTSTRHVLQFMWSADHTCLAREGPGSAPAAQTPSALGRPARSAACRSSAVRGEYRLVVRGVRLSARLSLGYRQGSCGGRGPQGTTRDGVFFTEVSSSSRSGSGSAAGISWCSGIILYFPKLMTRLGQCELEADASPNELNSPKSQLKLKHPRHRARPARRNCARRPARSFRARQPPRRWKRNPSQCAGSQREAYGRTGLGHGCT